MVKRHIHTLFVLYQLVSSVLLLPAGYALWRSLYHGDSRQALAIISVPVVFGYVVPGIGTNLTRLWRFGAGIRLGGFTALHGLMFGGASTVLAYGCMVVIQGTSDQPPVIASLALYAGVFALVNWLFDALALQYAIARIHNKPAYQGRGALAISADYAPVYFGSFGIMYGTTILALHALSWATAATFWGTWAALTTSTCALPVCLHAIVSKLRHGYFGLFPYRESER